MTTRDTSDLTIFLSCGRQHLITVQALVVRNLMAQYGRRGLGFLWLVLEPLILCTSVMIMWSVLHGSAKNGVQTVPMVLTGYSFLNVWRYFITQSNGILKKNMDLMYHKRIRYGDTIMAMAINVITGTFCAFWVAYAVLIMTGFTEPIYDYHNLCLAWILFSMLGFGASMIIATISTLFEAAARFIQPMMYVTIPLTGAFYMVGWFSPGIREILLWSPMVHGTEMIRGAYFGPTVTTFEDPIYLLRSALLVIAVGTIFFSIAQRNVKV